MKFKLLFVILLSLYIFVSPSKQSELKSRNNSDPKTINDVKISKNIVTIPSNIVDSLKKIIINYLVSGTNRIYVSFVLIYI